MGELRVVVLVDNIVKEVSGRLMVMLWSSQSGVVAVVVGLVKEGVQVSIDNVRIDIGQCRS